VRLGQAMHQHRGRLGQEGQALGQLLAQALHTAWAPYSNDPTRLFVVVSVFIVAL
jgi:hypothetical protein